jgi:hypothetical protein
MAAEGLITFDELRAKLLDLEGVRNTAERELKALRNRQELIEEMELDRDAFLTDYTHLAREALQELSPEELHEFCRMLRLQAVVRLGGPIEISGVLGEGRNFVLRKRNPEARSGAESVLFGRFEPNSGPPIALVMIFSTGLVLRSSIDASDQRRSSGPQRCHRGGFARRLMAEVPGTFRSGNRCSGSVMSGLSHVSSCSLGR